MVNQVAENSTEGKRDVELSTSEFARGFVASLIAEGLTSVEPQSQRDRDGFYRVYEFLQSQVEELRRAGQRNTRWYEGLVDIRNALKPSNNGAFDGFERLFRDLQLSMTSCPNPYYEEISLTVSKPYAKSVLDEFPATKRSIVTEAAERFLQRK